MSERRRRSSPSAPLARRSPGADSTTPSRPVTPARGITPVEARAKGGRDARERLWELTSAVTSDEQSAGREGRDATPPEYRDDGARALMRHLAESETPISGVGPVARGARGDETRWIQDRLAQLGADIAVDGVFGVQTQDMVRAFQVANRIAVTGVVDRLTAGMLQASIAKGIDHARLEGLPGVAIGKFETYDQGHATGAVDVVLLDGVRMASWLVPHWCAMRDAAAADGVRLSFNSSRSGFRTPEDQADLYRQYGSPRAVPPGWSNHQDGHALDLVMSPEAEAWMARHAATFGFVRPTYENWHWEYAG